jgi:hypothetical protein
VTELVLEELVLSTQDPHPTLQLLHLNGKQGLKGLYNRTYLMLLLSTQDPHPSLQLLHRKQELKGLYYRTYLLLVLSTQDSHPTLQLLHLSRYQIKGTVSCDRAGA